MNRKADSVHMQPRFAKAQARSKPGPVLDREGFGGSTWASSDPFKGEVRPLP